MKEEMELLKEYVQNLKSANSGGVIKFKDGDIHGKRQYAETNGVSSLEYGILEVIKKKVGVESISEIPIQPIFNILCSLLEARDAIENTILPGIMEEMGLANITLEDGTEIKLKKVVKGTVKDGERFYAWLREQGITVITTTVKSTSEEFYGAIEKALEDKEIDYEKKESIHWQTLQKIIRETVDEKGILAFPENTVSIDEITTAVVK